MNKFVVWSFAIMAILVASGRRSAADDTPAAVSPERKMIEAANQTYQSTLVAYEAGTGPNLDSLYVWSRRWMDAELQVAATPGERRVANIGHYDRMKLLSKEITAKYNVGAKGGEAENFYATEYYMAEAELWLKKAKTSNQPVEAK